MVGMPIAATPSGRKSCTINGKENKGTKPNVPEEINAKKMPLRFFIVYKVYKLKIRRKDTLSYLLQVI